MREVRERWSVAISEAEDGYARRFYVKERDNISFVPLPKANSNAKRFKGQAHRSKERHGAKAI
jgi:hypothetical protein